jgi:hypothetical protein
MSDLWKSTLNLTVFTSDGLPINIVSVSGSRLQGDQMRL